MSQITGLQTELAAAIEFNDRQIVSQPGLNCCRCSDSFPVCSKMSLTDSIVLKEMVGARDTAILVVIVVVPEAIVDLQAARSSGRLDQRHVIFA
jgi:hypothetical protein